ncbi:DNA-binding transcriptional regulator, MarR family [Paramicrobacterium humi]|uniref:DNA-binding transcriptional regulator, MarR family n=1 Tax=Paramicrobacterium humi TaxID=640635 RepID=A0A1H4NYA5_9MICO|nr:MarR family transcriptional regulator [Microbacterium humi]SEC00171.1 DNA-binding transcriptional regulator, MarR family [Microbacterium humi]
MTETTDDLLALESQLCFALAVASRGVIEAYRTELEPLHLTHPQYLVMLALWEHESCSLSQLATLLRLEPATLSPMVKRLEKLGYVSKRRGAADERTLVVALTPEGRALRADATAVPLAMMAKLQLTDDDVTKLREVTSRLIAATSAARAS